MDDMPTAIHIPGEPEARMLTDEQQQTLRQEAGPAIRTALKELAGQEYYQLANANRQARYMRTVERTLLSMVCVRMAAALQGKTISRTRIDEAAREVPRAIWLREVVGCLDGDQKAAFLQAHGDLLRKYFPSSCRQSDNAHAATMTED